VKDLNVHLAYSLYPKKGFINQLELLTNHHNYWNTDGLYTDYLSISGLHMISKNTEDIWAVYFHEKNTLRAPFDPSFRNIQELDSGYVTDFGYWRLSYASDVRKALSWVVVTDYGNYYSGTQSRLEGKINYRFQPYVNVGANATWMQYRLGAPYNTTDILYAGPKVDITFHRNLYWTTLVQYNSLYHNLNVFSRLQWRFRPLSDLFLIYSNNADTRQNLDSQNISLKISLWL
jgi:hypothetical protein